MTGETTRKRRISLTLTRAVQILLAIILIGSIVLNVFTWSELKREYGEMKSVRLDPLGVRETTFPATAPTDSAADSPLVLFFGDSRARAWPPPHASGWRFANRGIDGQTTEQSLGRMTDQVSALKPNVVVLECGINDLTAIGVMLEKRAAIASRCEENLRKMIAIARKDGATVIVATIFPTGPVSLGRRPFWSDQIGDAVKAVNMHLCDIHQPGVLILDADTILLDGGKVRSNFYQDTLHLKPPAYEALNGALRAFLRSVAR